MKAAYIEQTGSPKNIIYGDLPRPEPSETQVLVKVAAVAVNPVDTYVRAGTVEMDLPKPFVVGCDLAGVVEEVGSAVKRFSPGDRVWGSNQGVLGRQGTFAEYAAVDECWLYSTPEDVSDEDAAATALVGITAHLGTFRDADLKMGDTVFVNGGTGGVGSCVVQMAKAVGARVVTTVGGEEKRKATRKLLGTNTAIDFKVGGVSETISRMAPEGIDVWFETLREHDLKMAVEHMKLRGRIIVIAGHKSDSVLPIGQFYLKDCKLFGFAMFNSPHEEQRKSAAEINRWMARGKLRAKIDRVMPLEETAAAHRLQEKNTLKKAGTLFGKIVLKP